MRKAIVLQSISGISKLKDLETSIQLLGELKGTLLNESNKVIPGDYVEYISNDGVNLITKINERKNFWTRPKIANIDYLIIIQSLKEPDLNVRLLNKYILFFQSQKIDNVILFFTKYDILDSKEKIKADEIINNFNKDGFNTFYSDALDTFLKFINSQDKKVICFAGQSGVGKSTLLNKINNNFSIKTNEISKALNRGKHTTTSTLLYENNNGYLVDTPGFSSININMKKEDLAIGYKDFRIFSLKCKYNNCLHNTENNCEIKNKVNEGVISKQRYEDYLYFLKNIK